MCGFVPRTHGGFALAEVLIVVIMSGLLLVLVVPRLTRAANPDGEQSLRYALQQLRTQIMIYQVEHHGVAPGYPGGDTTVAPTHATLVAQLTQYTNQAGDVSATPSEAFSLGPYLKRIPTNPLARSADVRFLDRVDVVPSASGPQAWVYQPTTGMIACNTAGADIHGVRYTDY